MLQKVVQMSKKWEKNVNKYHKKLEKVIIKLKKNHKKFGKSSEKVKNKVSKNCFIEKNNKGRNLKNVSPNKFRKS